jgi:hypothetical protein
LQVSVFHARNVLLIRPSLEIVLQAAVPRMVGKAVRTKSGRKVRVEFEPADEFRCIYRYGNQSLSADKADAELTESLDIPTQA